MNFMNGTIFRDWINLLVENKFRIAPKYWTRVVIITLISLRNSRLAKKDKKILKNKLDNIKIHDPIFILGHWRSGTTLIHKLFSLDDQFAFPNLFQVSNPYTFLSGEEAVEKALGNLKAEKRPMDNMEVTFRDPGEDESAVSVLSQRSPLVSWGFTKNDKKYFNYHTFEKVDEKDYKRWESSFLYFLKKLTYRYNKPLVLKSPIHTGRIKILLKLFPNARFIHVYRDPYTVFQSTRRLYKKMLPTTALQKIDFNEWDSFILRNYKCMYDSFFRDKNLIPQNSFYEISFEEFEKNILKNFKNIYNKLNIPNFEIVEPKIREYITTISNYKKNDHKPLEIDIKNKLRKEWAKNFQEWDDFKNN